MIIEWIRSKYKHKGYKPYLTKAVSFVFSGIDIDIVVNPQLGFKNKFNSSAKRHYMGALSRTHYFNVTTKHGRIFKAK